MLSRSLARNLGSHACRRTPSALPNLLPLRRYATTQAAPDVGGASDPHAYCKDFVQKRDYESYLISQFYPPEYRDGFYALRAFYVRHSFSTECAAVC